MNPYILTALIVLALASTIQYYLGAKKNRVLASSISREVEQALGPVSTNYVNIGGHIGYNFSYAMGRVPWHSAKGTLTLMPRHSLLYLPLSRILGVGADRLYLNLFTKRSLLGEAHLVAAGELGRAKIDGAAAMQKKQTEVGGKKYFLLWHGADLSGQLEALIAALPDPTLLRHFCAYADNKTFFIRLAPKNGKVRAQLEAMLPRLETFMKA